MRRLTLIVPIIITLSAVQCAPVPTPVPSPTPTSKIEPTSVATTPISIQGNLRVWVRDRDTGAYIISASVAVVGPSGTLDSDTDLLGQAYFGVLNPGLYTVSATFRNYVPSNPEEVEIFSGNTLSHTLYLALSLPTPTNTLSPATDTQVNSIPTQTSTPVGTGQPAPTVTPLYGPVILFDPPDGGTFAAFNTILRWKTDHNLKPDEEFDVLVWSDGSVKQTSIGSTTDTTFPIDFRNWQYGSGIGKFFWTIRIKRADGVYLSDSAKPFSFVQKVPEPPPPVAVKPYPAPPEISLPDRNRVTSEIQLIGLSLFTISVVGIASFVLRKARKRWEISRKQGYAPTRV